MMIDVLVLSPHLDDAPLSLGGAIWQWTQAGQKVLVVSMMAGDPPPMDFSDFAQQLHSQWGASAQKIIAQRRQEDKVSCDILGADYTHWSYLDAIYRRDKTSGFFLYPTWEHIITTDLAGDEPLIAQLTEQFAQLPATARVFAPLGVGQHIDHRVVRAAAERYWGEDLTYYEDFPYVLQEGALEKVVDSDTDWLNEIISLSVEAIDTKCHAIRAHVSQIGTLFKSANTLEKIVHSFADKRGGERFWHTQKTRH